MHSDSSDEQNKVKFLIDLSAGSINLTWIIFETLILTAEKDFIEGVFGL
jgi:hypothetical protein